MKYLVSVMLVCLVSVSSAGAEPEGYLDGTDWVGFTAEYKLALVEATQEELRDQGMTTKYAAVFYVVAVNEFYSDAEHLQISFADAMSIIGFPLGEFKVKSPEKDAGHHEIDQPLLSERADAVEVDEVRTRLQDELLAGPVSSAPKQPVQRHVVQPGDTLASIADQSGVTLPMLERANRLETDRINPGQRLIIPTISLRLQIDKSENLLTLFNDLEPIRTYPVATGDQGITPVGTYTIANRLIGPTWYWQGYAVPPDDPEYPLGSRWLGLSKRGYGIHGTNEPESIGQQISHGCIRMYNEDVEELFDVVPVGTVVTIIE